MLALTPSCPASSLIGGNSAPGASAPAEMASSMSVAMASAPAPRMVYCPSTQIIMY